RTLFVALLPGDPESHSADDIPVLASQPRDRRAAQHPGWNLRAQDPRALSGVGQCHCLLHVAAVHGAAQPNLELLLPRLLGAGFCTLFRRRA
nr:hypothetical protein [Tanacetum cinerariifolium]